MTKLFNEVKDLTLEDSTKLLTNVSHIDLVREYKQLADLMCVEKEVVIEPEPKPKRICISCDNIVTGRAKKCDTCKAIPKLKQKEATNANSH